MQEYCYLTKLEDSPYNLTMDEALHLGATGRIPTYIFITYDITAYPIIPDSPTNLRDRLNLNGTFLKASKLAVRHLEKTPFGSTAMKDGHLDYRSNENPSGAVPFHQLEDCHRKNFAVEIRHNDLSIEVSDLLLFTDDLEDLAGKGLIKRKNANEQQGTQLGNTEHQEHSSANAPLDNESDVKRLERTVAALALGLAAKYPAYRCGEKPNISQLTSLAIDHLRSEQDDRAPDGFGKSTIGDTIKAALESFPELKER